MKKIIVGLLVGMLLFPTMSFAATTADEVIADGQRYLGVKYLFGGDYKEDGSMKMDCSYFTRYVFRQNGVYLPRTSLAQSQVGKFVYRSSLKKGDLMFFDTNEDKKINHVGIYMGNGKFIHASPAGPNGVQISSLSGFWSRTYVKAKRVL